MQIKLVYSTIAIVMYCFGLCGDIANVPISLNYGNWVWGVLHGGYSAFLEDFKNKITFEITKFIIFPEKRTIWQINNYTIISAMLQNLYRSEFVRVVPPVSEIIEASMLGNHSVYEQSTKYYIIYFSKH